MVIKPLVGVDDLLLGSDRDAVVQSLGTPDRVRSKTWPDKSDSEHWEYDRLAVDVTFASNDDYRLGTIAVRNERAELNGLCLIGLKQEDFLGRIKSAGIDVALEDSFDDIDARDYVCDRLSLSFWFWHGILDSITLMPEYDDSGNVPIWPRDSSGSEGPPLSANRG